ncbi:hypothetical protein D3C84_92130 [compost metagenome]
MIPPGNSGSLSSATLATIALPVSTAFVVPVPVPEVVGLAFTPTAAFPSEGIDVVSKFSVFLAISGIFSEDFVIIGFMSWSFCMGTSGV